MHIGPIGDKLRRIVTGLLVASLCEPRHGLTIVRFAALTGGKRGFNDADFLVPIVEAHR
jgi:hypothetical protein